VAANCQGLEVQDQGQGQGLDVQGQGQALYKVSSRRLEAPRGQGHGLEDFHHCYLSLKVKLLRCRLRGLPCPLFDVVVVVWYAAL